MKRRSSAKRLVALVLRLCVTAATLPSSVYAAIGDLTKNTARENQSILERLENFTGDSYEEAFELLRSLGLLDENGQLITDKTLVLNGAEYTLDQIEALLSAPDTDLTQVGYVDGVPIRLSDLKTVIAIERELEYLQEKYFTGQTFEGEALENLDRLLAQLQSSGITLQSSGSAVSVPVFSQEGSDSNINGYDSYYVRSNAISLEAGDTFKVKFKLAVPEAFRKINADTTIRVALDRTKNAHAPFAYVDVKVADAIDDPDKEYGRIRPQPERSYPGLRQHEL